MSGLRQPGPLGVRSHESGPVFPMVHVTSLPSTQTAKASRSTAQPATSNYKAPTFLDAIQDREFWRGYGESVLSVGKEASYMILGELSVYSGWVLSKVPGGAIAGRYMMVDGASTYLGAMCNVSKIFHGPAVQCVADDYVGEAYRSASEFYTGDESYGDMVRATVSIGAIIRANTLPVLIEKYRGSPGLHHWVTVRGYETSNKLLYAGDVYSLGDSMHTLWKKSKALNDTGLVDE